MSSYNYVVGSDSPVQPSFPSLTSITLNNVTPTVQLSWSSGFVDSNNVVANIIRVFSDQNGRAIVMPNAMQASVGLATIINNITGFTVNIYLNDGVTLLTTLAGGSSTWLDLYNTTTINGLWDFNPFGGGGTAITGVAAVSSNADLTIAGSPINVNGTFTFNLAGNTLALSNLGGTGYSARTGVGTWALRTFQNSTNLTVTNPAGIAGNTSYALNSNLVGLTGVTVGNLFLSGNILTTTAGTLNLRSAGSQVTTNSNFTIAADGATKKSLTIFNANNTNSFDIVASDSMTASTQYTWPATPGAAGSVMSIDGSNNLYFSSFTLPVVERAEIIYNSTFQVWQRNTSFTNATYQFVNNNNTYTADRWLLLSDGNNIVNITRGTGVEPIQYSWLSTVVTGNKKWGIVEILETRDTASILENLVSLQITTRNQSANINNFQFAILGWTGTADAPTANLVTAWNAVGFNPTLAANWSYIELSGLLTFTTTYADYNIDGVTLPSNLTNVALFAWIDDDTAVPASDFEISKFSLQVGSSYVGSAFIPFEQQLTQCKRYFQKSAVYNVAVGTAGTNDSQSTFVPTPSTIANNAVYCKVPLEVEMLKQPTVVTYPITTVANTGRWSADTGVDFAVNSAVVSTLLPSAKCFVVENTSGGVLTFANGYVRGNWFASAEF